MKFIRSVLAFLGYVAIAALTYQLIFNSDRPNPVPVSSSTSEPPALEVRPLAAQPNATFERVPPLTEVPDARPLEIPKVELPSAPPQATSNSVCGTKTYCNQMKSCAEAKYFLDECGLDRLDADSDGIPCETACGKTMGTMTARLRAHPFTPEGDGTALGFVGAESAGPELRCAGKRTCKQMDSCEEATFYLTKCGARSLDGNRDSVACNGLCSQ